MRRRVTDVMTRTVVVVRDHAPIKDIVRTMDEHRVSAVPVVDAHGRPVGIVSEADLLQKEEHLERDPPRRLEGWRRRDDRTRAGALDAATIMTTPVIVISSSATLAAAARAMRVNGVKRLPVIDATGRLMGIVS